MSRKGFFSSLLVGSFKGLFVAGLAPLVYALFDTILRAFKELWARVGFLGLWPYLAGMGAYALLERIFSRPIRLYVFGHEITHALSCFLSGGRVYDLHASKRGGHVRLSKTNAWIALSPYCVPIYTFAILILWRVAILWTDMARWETPVQALVGASLAFHVSLTIYALRGEQPDLRGPGFALSLMLILLANGAVLLVLIALLFPAAAAPRDIAEAFAGRLKKTGVGLLSIFREARGVLASAR